MNLLNLINPCLVNVYCSDTWINPGLIKLNRLILHISPCLFYN
jgi:hypothetical protein